NSAMGAYSCQVYIKAVQEDSFVTKKKGAKEISPQEKTVDELKNMSMAEIILRLNRESAKRMREQRIAVTKNGKPESLFFLSTTEGDFNLYNNLLNIPALSETPFLSPVSYSGLMAYKFKTIKVDRTGGKKIYTISVKPRQISNATIEGELTIIDSSYVIIHSNFRLP